MEILELDESFQPKTELGKAMKMMVENGDHCDGNIYWLIQLLEQKQEENKMLSAFKFHSVSVMTDHQIEKVVNLVRGS